MAKDYCILYMNVFGYFIKKLFSRLFLLEYDKNIIGFFRFLFRTKQNVASPRRKPHLKIPQREALSVLINQRECPASCPVLSPRLHLIYFFFSYSSAAFQTSRSLLHLFFFPRFFAALRCRSLPRSRRRRR